MSTYEGSTPKPGDPGGLDPQHHVEAGGSEGDYAVSEPTPPPAAAGSPAGSAAEASTGWYTAPPGGQPQGPFTLELMRSRAASGELLGGHFVWREGMPNWLRAAEVREIFGRAREGPPPLPQGPGGPAAAAGPGAALPLGAILARLDRWFADPMVYRYAGYAAAAMAVVVLALSVLLMALAGGHWFTGVVLFLLVFVACQAAAAMLEAVGRLEKRLAERPQGPDTPDGKAPAGSTPDDAKVDSKTSGREAMR
jgi:hypothetical protein